MFSSFSYRIFHQSTVEKLPFMHFRETYTNLEIRHGSLFWHCIHEWFEKHPGHEWFLWSFKFQHRRYLTREVVSLFQVSNNHSTFHSFVFIISRRLRRSYWVAFVFSCWKLSVTTTAIDKLKKNAVYFLCVVNSETYIHASWFTKLDVMIFKIIKIKLFYFYQIKHIL